MRPTWGNPWRGKLQNWALQLPNGTVKQVPQPQPIWQNQRDESGYTYLQRGPNAGVTRTADELADDAAAGRTWRDDAILSGARMMLYGQESSCWVYCAPDGSRWLIPAWKFAAAVNTAQPMTVSMTLYGYGDVGKPAVEQIVEVSLVDLLQQEPDPEHPIGTDAYSIVCDISEDGSRALIMLFKPFYPFSSTGWHPLHKRPLGWLELTLAGGIEGIGASLRVVRSRAETLGNGELYIQRLETVSAYRTPYTITRVDKGDYWEQTITANPLSDAGGIGLTHGEGDYAFGLTVNNRILAMWYRGAELEECTYSLAVTASASNPPPTESISGSAVRREYKTSGEVVQVTNDLEHSRTRSCSGEESFTLTLKVGGQVVDQSTGSSTTSLQQTHWWDHPDGSGKFQASGVSTVTVDGETSSEPLSASAHGPNETQELRSISGRWLESMANGASAVECAYRSDYMLAFQPHRHIDFEFVRYSNKLLGIRRGEYILSGADVTTYNYGPAAHPGGVDSGHVDGPLLAVYGSYNPATGEVVRNQTTPVCYV